jgi:pimeloyl-ACP methyl ester carboxylesterase
VQAETLIVWGTADRLVSVRVAPRALAAFPHSRLLVLPGVGHVAQMERPETVARAFLALKEDAEAHRATDPR